MSSVGCFGHLVSVLELAASLNCGEMITAAETAVAWRYLCPWSSCPHLIGLLAGGWIIGCPRWGAGVVVAGEPSPLALICLAV